MIVISSLKIYQKTIRVDNMMNATTFMDGFMNKLNADGFTKDNQPNKGPELTRDFIDEQIKAFDRLLNFGLIESATRENNK